MPNSESHIAEVDSMLLEANESVASGIEGTVGPQADRLLSLLPPEVLIRLSVERGNILDLKVAAIAVVGRAATHAPREAERILRPYLADSDADVRVAAVTAGWTAPLPGLKSAILHLASEDPAALVRMECADYLGRVSEGDDARACLSHMLLDSDGAVRILAARNLWFVGSAREVPALRAALEDAGSDACLVAHLRAALYVVAKDWHSLVELLQHAASWECAGLVVELLDPLHEKSGLAGSPSLPAVREALQSAILRDSSFSDASIDRLKRICGVV